MNERRNDEYKTAWEAARLVAFYAVAPHAKKGSFKKFSDIAAFPWEAPQKGKLKTDKQLQAAMEAEWQKMLAEQPLQLSDFK